MEVPILRTTQTVLFPGALLPVILFEEEDLELLSATCASDDLVFGFLFDLDLDRKLEPGAIGTAAQIIQQRRSPKGDVMVVVKGLERIRVVEIVGEKPFTAAKVEMLRDPAVIPEKELETTVKVLFDRYLETCTGDVEGVRAAMAEVSTLGRMIDIAMTCVPVPPEDRQRVLEILDPVRRAGEMIILYRKHMSDSGTGGSAAGDGLPGFSVN